VSDFLSNLTPKPFPSGKKFVCGHCGWVDDADLNGAKNISAIAKSAVLGSTQEEQLFKTGAVIVNQPRHSGLSCKLDVHIGRKTEYVQLNLFDISRASQSSHLSR
jgi:putative transposase